MRRPEQVRESPHLRYPPSALLLAALFVVALGGSAIADWRIPLVIIGIGTVCFALAYLLDAIDRRAGW